MAFRGLGREMRGLSWRLRVLAMTVVSLLGIAAMGPGSAAASEPLLTQFCETGVAGGQCETPRGIAVDPVSGDIYVADTANSRIEKFSAWGQFLRAWGWDVVASGPDNTTAGRFEICVAAAGDVCKAGISATGALGPGPKGSAGAGQFASPRGVALDAAGDVYVADQAGSGNIIPSNRVQKFDPEGHFLLMFGGDVIADGAEGTGTVTPGSTTVTGVATTAKLFRIGQPIEATGIEAGTSIAALGSGTITLSQPAGPAATGSPTAIGSPAGPHNVAANEIQTVRLGANTTGGTFSLTFTTPNPSPSSATATAIPFDATALELEEKLVGLSNIGAGNVAVSGPAGGPWAVEFKGPRYSDTDVESLSPNPENLIVSPSTGAKQVSVTSAKGGEVCAVAAECQAASVGVANGEFSAWEVGSFIASSPDGETIYVGDVGRVQDFDTAGHYLGNFPDASGLLGKNSMKALAVDPASGDLYVSFGSGIATLDAGPDVYRLAAGSGSEVCKTGSGEAETPTAVATSASGDVYVANGLGLGQPPTSLRELLRFGSDCGGKEVLFDEAELKAQGFTENPTGLATSSACGIKGTEFIVANPDSSNSFVRIYGPPPQSFAPPCSPPLSLPPSIEDQYATSVGASGATLRAEINPLFWPDTRYYVQYGTGKCSTGGCESVQPLSPGLLLTEAVTKATLLTKGIALSGLQPATTYHFRFVAESSGGGPVFGVDPDGEGPEGASVEAGLEGTFTTHPQPAGAPVDCPNQAFRSGFSSFLPECRAYEMVSPLEKNNGDIATDESFAPHPGPGSLAGNFQLVSPDGGRATYSSLTSFGSSEGSPLFGQYLSSRDPETGWSTRSISPPRSSVPFYGPTSSANTSQFKTFSEDLCQGWFIQDNNFALTPDQPAGVANIDRRNTCGEAEYELLTPVQPEGYPSEGELEHGESAYFPTLQGLTADGKTALLRINAAMSPDACRVTIEKEGEVLVQEGKGLYQLYLHKEGDGEMRLVSLLPSGQPACVHSSAGTAQGLQGGFREDNVYHALSSDGSRVFWSTDAGLKKLITNGGAFGDEAGQLYLRLNPDQPPSAQKLGSATGKGNLNSASKTISGLSTATGAFAAGQSIGGQGIPGGTKVASVGASFITISANPTQSGSGVALEAWSECTEPDKACTLQISPSSDARFWGADPAGSTAIYTAGGGLFEYDVATDSSAAIAPSGVLGVMGMSEDVSHVYFASTAVLSGEQENSEGAKAQAGKPNLYLFVNGGGTVFIGTLAGDDTQNGATSAAPPSPIAALPDLRVSRVSADGAHAAFVSAAPLTGYANKDISSGLPDAEVFLYDAGVGGGAGQLRCISCDPSGARPSGQNLSFISKPYSAAAQIPGWESEFYPGRVLSDDGQRLFFESFEGLAPRDTNEKRDVYEWRRGSSAAECIEELGFELYVPAAGGCIGLISSGKDSVNAEFLDASTSGSDVFFLTAADLLPQDPGLIDVYDARIEGGFPPPKTPTPPCEGEACQPSPPPPEAKTPASAAFEGQGNVSEGPDCDATAGRARRLGLQAKRLRRAAGRISDPRRAKALAHRGRRLSAKAKRLSKNARRCRARAKRGAGK
jgi:NHL repeat-containing protein